jgi:hypothetical protein
VHERLWLGVDRRIREAQHSSDEMWRALQPPERTWNVAPAADVNLDTCWQDTFYGCVATFLAKVRSVPWLIESCFGADRANWEMRVWLDGLPTDEQDRREDFSRQFRNEPDWKALRDHDLTSERNVAEHRLGFPNIEATVIGPFGTKHIGRRTSASRPRRSGRWSPTSTTTRR